MATSAKEIFDVSFDLLNKANQEELFEKFNCSDRSSLETAFQSFDASKLINFENILNFMTGISFVYVDHALDILGRTIRYDFLSCILPFL